MKPLLFIICLSVMVGIFVVGTAEAKTTIMKRREVGEFMFALPRAISSIEVNRDQNQLVFDKTSCAKAYRVVMIFRQAEDYKTQPWSYVFNRAYPCKNQQWELDLRGESLPPNLADGEYYVVLGEQGETGTWSIIDEPFPLRIYRERREVVEEIQLPEPPVVVEEDQKPLSSKKEERLDEVDPIKIEVAPELPMPDKIEVPIDLDPPATVDENPDSKSDSLEDPNLTAINRVRRFFGVVLGKIFGSTGLGYNAGYYH